MAAMLKPVDAATAARLKDQGALLVDIREPGEYARVHIPGSANVALSGFQNATLALGPNQPVVYLCASGNRTAVYAAQLAAKAGTAEAFVLTGGISAWMGAGLPTDTGGGDATPARGWSLFRS
jgi:rhodanese-related sulfurtransferase